MAACILVICDQGGYKNLSTHAAGHQLQGFWGQGGELAPHWLLSSAPGFFSTWLFQDHMTRPFKTNDDKLELD